MPAATPRRFSPATTGFTGDYGLVEKTRNTVGDCPTRIPLVIKPPLGVPLAADLHERELVELTDVPAVDHPRYDPWASDIAW
jgi:hypothetical protein